MGVAAGGHYTAYCRNFMDGCWYEMDDQRVTKINQSDVESALGPAAWNACTPHAPRLPWLRAEAVVTRNAYVLFYRRRPTGDAGSPDADRGGAVTAPAGK